MFSVQWRKIEYNIGNSFDGTRFNAPKAGLYTFHATAHRNDKTSATTPATLIYFYVNDSCRIYSRDQTDDNDEFSQPIQTTLRLNRSDTVEVRLNGIFDNTNDGDCTCFEGIYIPRID